ncbi:hypothetical protein PMSD_10325 [Paenibacillus macquariensis subsp. defensor]|nr:hypothetical protein PMSD_10325 [Paenibacillus macquariensis subsp. defensor]
MSLHNQLLLKSIRSKLMVIFLIILIAFTMNPLLTSQKLPLDHQGLTKELIKLYVSIANDNVFLFLYIPLFLLFILQFITILYRNNVLLKYTDIRSWWKSNVILIIKLSVFFTVIIQIFIIGLLFTKGLSFGNLVTIYIPFCIIAAVIQLLGFIIIGEFCLIIACIFHQPYWGLFIPILVLFLIKASKFIMKAEWYTFEEYMSSIYKIKIDNSAQNITDPMIIMSFAIFAILLYWFGSNILKDKDFYWG